MMFLIVINYCNDFFLIYTVKGDQRVMIPKIAITTLPVTTAKSRSRIISKGIAGAHGQNACIKGA